VVHCGGKAWIHASLLLFLVAAAGNPPNLVQQIVDLSMASGVTSAHTAMVGFETTPQRYEQMQVRCCSGVCRLAGVHVSMREVRALLKVHMQTPLSP
jgi:hypothetical protein